MLRLNKFGKILLTSLFLTYLFVIGIYKIWAPDLLESEVEFRKLVQKPRLTLNNFIDATYMKDFEAYFTDQFPGRNVWLENYINYQLLSNKTYVYSYYMADENIIMPKPDFNFSIEGKAAIEETTEKVNSFSAYLKQNNKEFYIFLTPHKYTTLEFLYPNYIRQGSLREAVDHFMANLNEDNVISVDMTKEFSDFSEKELKNMYWKTDHHWNINGALEGYKIIANTLEKHSKHGNVVEESLDNDYYQRACANDSTPFIGTYNRQLYLSVNTDDEENMCTLINDEVFSNFEVVLNGKKVEPYEVYATGIFGESKERIYYGDIFTNDLREIKIINEKNKGSGNILIVKDSYANPIIYHIAQNFHQTTVYDPRYNQDRTIKEYIEANDFDAVAIVYNSTHLTGANYNFDTPPK